jgi:cytochrome c biogenesis protein CcdA
MSDLWSVLLPILLADIVNPVLFAFMVYAARTGRPLINSTAVLLGHTARYLVFGIILGFAFETISERLANPRSIDFSVGLVVGLLLWVAWRSSRANNTKQSEPDVEHLTPLKAFGIGAVINIIGLPFALPYFAALDQILKADLSVTNSVLAVSGYNLAYAAPFLVVPALTLLLGDESRPLLARINERVDRVSALLMPLMLLLVGAAVVADAVCYFAVGEGLF